MHASCWARGPGPWHSCREVLWCSTADGASGCVILILVLRQLPANEARNRLPLEPQSAWRPADACRRLAVASGSANFACLCKVPDFATGLEPMVSDFASGTGEALIGNGCAGTINRFEYAAVIMIEALLLLMAVHQASCTHSSRQSHLAALHTLFYTSLTHTMIIQS